jgi:uncharacterized protein
VAGRFGATGPFYCPTDRKVYLDTAFFTTLSQRLGPQGDFAAAYVVAHEVAHHIQNELGILRRPTASGRAPARTSRTRSPSGSSCRPTALPASGRETPPSAGHAGEGDIAEALNAAARIGDDTLQRNAGRRPMPDSFTHGTSEQRQRWFATGYRAAT